MCSCYELPTILEEERAGIEGRVHSLTYLRMRDFQAMMLTQSLKSVCGLSPSISGVKIRRVFVVDHCRDCLQSRGKE